MRRISLLTIEPHILPLPSLVLRVLVSAISFASLTVVAADQAEANAQGHSFKKAMDGWMRFSSMDFRMSSQNSGIAMNANFTFTENNDVILHVQENDAKAKKEKVSSSKMILVDKRVLLYQGKPLKDRRAIDALDGPMLLKRLLLAMLATTVGHPSNLGKAKVKKLDASDEKTPICIGTTSGMACLAAPWKIVGTVRREDAKVHIDLRAQSKSNSWQPHYRGTWIDGKRRPAIARSMKLDGWKVYNLGVRKSKTRYEDQTSPSKSKPSTLEEALQSSRKN